MKRFGHKSNSLKVNFLELKIDSINSDTQFNRLNIKSVPILGHWVFAKSQNQSVINF